MELDAKSFDWRWEDGKRGDYTLAYAFFGIKE